MHREQNENLEGPLGFLIALNFSQNTARAAPKVVINNGKSKIKNYYYSFLLINSF
jgi:hypothetical protein